MTKNRTPIPRYSVPKRGAAPQRKVGVRKVNPERRARRYERAYLSPAYVAFIHWTGCVVPNCARSPIHACHRTPRSRGGTWQDLFGACAGHHALQHRIGVTAFARLAGVDLEAACARNVFEWRKFAE